MCFYSSGKTWSPGLVHYNWCLNGELVSNFIPYNSSFSLFPVSSGIEKVCRWINFISCFISREEARSLLLPKIISAPRHPSVVNAMQVAILIEDNKLTRWHLDWNLTHRRCLGRQQAKSDMLNLWPWGPELAHPGLLSSLQATVEKPVHMWTRRAYIRVLYHYCDSLPNMAPSQGHPWNLQGLSRLELATIWECLAPRSA